MSFIFSSAKSYLNVILLVHWDTPLALQAYYGAFTSPNIVDDFVKLVDLDFDFLHVVLAYFFSATQKRSLRLTTAASRLGMHYICESHYFLLLR